MATLTCDDPLHASRSALPGWSATLGTGPAPVSGLRCRACANANATAYVADVAQTQDLRSRALAVAQTLDDAATNWDTLTAGQKDAAMKICVAATSRLCRLVARLTA